MKTVVTICALLGASGVLAHPPRLPGWETASTKHDLELPDPAPGSRVMRPLKGQKAPGSSAKDTKNDLITSNWSGAIRYASSGQLITSVAATFTVPAPSVPTNKATGAYSGSAWIGLGGASANDSLWQAGFGWTIDNSSSPYVKYTGRAWYEWLPNGEAAIAGFNPLPGHVYSIHLNADRPGTGAVVLADLTDGHTASVTTSSPNPTATLKGLSAEWITEDYSQGGLVPFANYGRMKYTGAVWGDYSGASGGSAGSTIVDIQASNGKINSQGSLVGSNEVDTVYQYV